MPILTEAFTPPTTSLYQFMALSGLVVFMFFQYLLHSALKVYLAKQAEAKLARVVVERKTEDLKVKHDLRMRMAHLELDTIEEEIDLLKEEVGNATTMADNRKSEIVERLMRIHHDRLEKVKTIYSDMRKNQEDLSQLYLASKQFEIAADEHSFASDNYLKVKRSLGSASFFSLGWSALGFFLWYVKIQQFQDILLAHQALGK